MSDHSYDEQNVQVYRDVDHIRQRPGIYFYDTGERGLFHWISEAVYFVLRERFRGACNQIDFALLPDGGFQIGYDGELVCRPTRDRDFVRLLLTTPGPWSSQNPDPIACGFHGVGMPAVSALASRLIVETHFEGEQWQQDFSRGNQVSNFRRVEKTVERGTRFTLWPDPEIFTLPRTIDVNRFLLLFRDLAWLHPGLTLTLTDERSSQFRNRTFYAGQGERDEVERLNEARRPVHKQIFHHREEWSLGGVEIAFQWVTSNCEQVKGFCNSVQPREGGTHLIGLCRGIQRVLSDRLVEADRDLQLCDYLEGLTALIHIQIPNAMFGVSTKVRLWNPEVLDRVADSVERTFTRFLEEHPEDATAIVNRVRLAYDRRIEAQAKLPPGRFYRDPKTGIWQSSQDDEDEEEHEEWE